MTEALHTRRAFSILRRRRARLITNWFADKICSIVDDLRGDSRTREKRRASVFRSASRFPFPAIALERKCASPTCTSPYRSRPPFARGRSSGIRSRREICCLRERKNSRGINSREPGRCGVIYTVREIAIGLMHLDSRIYDHNHSRKNWLDTEVGAGCSTRIL